jgi:hypothetical protein
MNPEREKALKAQIQALFEQAGGRMTEDELYRRVMQSEIFGRTDLEEFERQGAIGALERVLRHDPELRRRVREEGDAALDDPLVRARLLAALEANVADAEEPE